jgi:molybdate transport system regulatory protein
LSPLRDKKIDATLALRSEGRLLVGRDRIKVLEAVAEHGSISQAAKATGFSYKGAWDAVTAINNLLPSPAFVLKAGGRSGGGAEVTAEGRKLIEAFHRLEERLTRISSAIALDGLEGLDDFFLWSVGFQISARNVFQAEVVKVEAGPVDVEVVLRLSDQLPLHAIVTNDALEELDLKPGRRALALVKSSFVELSRVDAPPLYERNRLLGRITRRIDAAPRSELLLDIGGGKSLTAVISHARAETLGLVEGDEAAAQFAPENVILAIA